MKNRITLKELVIKAVPFRVDGKWHDYAIYIKTDDADVNLWGCAGSEASYNPGEVVELEDGRTAWIDREL
jgi:hypothetical protein